MDSSFWFDTINLGLSIVYIYIVKYNIIWNYNLCITGYNLKNIIFLSQKIDFVLANSWDPDEMLLIAAFHLGLHWLQKYAFRSH